MFIYADFSSLLPEDNAEGEAALSATFYEEAGCVLTPGTAQFDNRAGWYRICYAFNTPEILEIAMDRIENTVEWVRERGWHDLDVEGEIDEITKSGLRRRGSSFVG